MAISRVPLKLVACRQFRRTLTSISHDQVPPRRTIVTNRARDVRLTKSFKAKRRQREDRFQWIIRWTKSSIAWRSRLSLAAFQTLREIGKSHFPSDLWDAVPLPDTEADIASAADWLQKNIADHRPTGVYLGLDTLNQAGQWGQNVEIGLSDAADPSLHDIEWIYDGLGYGDNHLIRGLYQVHQAYDAFQLGYPQSLFPDYVLFLGYSGIVLAGAMRPCGPTGTRFLCGAFTTATWATLRERRHEASSDSVKLAEVALNSCVRGCHWSASADAAFPSFPRSGLGTHPPSADSASRPSSP